jgi:arylsulfatase
MAPAIHKDNSVPHEFIYFNHSNNRALRAGDWKLVAAGANGPWELYNLATDRCESKNLASAQPERVSAMAARWKQVDEEFVKRRESSRPVAKDRL